MVLISIICPEGSHGIRGKATDTVEKWRGLQVWKSTKPVKPLFLRTLNPDWRNWRQQPNALLCTLPVRLFWPLQVCILFAFRPLIDLLTKLRTTRKLIISSIFSTRRHIPQLGSRCPRLPPAAASGNHRQCLAGTPTAVPILSKSMESLRITTTTTATTTRSNRIVTEISPLLI